MIYANVKLTVQDYETKFNNKIVLYRGDKNVEIRFVVEGSKFVVLDSTYAQMIIKRPSATSIFSEPAPIEGNTVILTITEDMIDEFKEVGEYTFQIRLYDDTMNACATLPPCYGGLDIQKPIAVDGEATINTAMVNDSAVMSIAAYDDGTPEEELFDENNSYNRTRWVDGDIITDSRMNKIEDALYYINEKGGGGTATAPYISTALPESVLVGSGEDFLLDLDFSSPNMGKGSLRVFINDVDVMTTKIDQGITNTVISGDLFFKGTNMVVVYVLDRVGLMSNSLTFYVRYGGTEVSSTFDAYVSYDYGATVRYYFTPTALDTSLPLTFYMEIDGATQNGVPCVSDVRSYYTFPTDLAVGNHYCRAWVTDGTTRSNMLTFNLIILDATSLVVASDTLDPTVEEGMQLILDYKVYMKNNTRFITKTYVDGNLANTGECTLETAYYRTTSLLEGTHTIKVEVFDMTQTYSDFVTWTVTVTPSTYTMLEPAKAGSLFSATAYSKSNVDENKDVWIGTNQDNQNVEATLTNFTFNSENGWIDDELVISGNSWVEIPIAPLANNAQYGFTLDVEFSTKNIGVEDAEVLMLWNEEDNCGIKITTEQLILRSKSGSQCDLYFPEDETVSAMFVIDRDEKTAKIYLNGVMCEAFALSDYEAAGEKYLEDFTVDSHIFLGGYNKNGYSKIRNIRVYEVALATNEILDNFMSNEKNKAAQKELVEFQKGNTLPTMTIYCDFSGLGKDDKKPCNIVYNSPDVNLYGESFTLDGKHSMLQYQGTSSMQYPIKNYRINPRNADGKVKLDPFKNGVAESRFTLKADFMSSGHWQNTGMAKFVNDCLYNYDPNDEKSMNPAKWYSLQNGGKVTDTREAINGFPCRLILVNDGETRLNEGQQEPTPGNTKDMGVFNFNNDKDNVNTLGLDTEIFPNCISYEVTANSDTSAGAFVPYEPDYKIYFRTDAKDNTCVLPSTLFDQSSNTISSDGKMSQLHWWNDSTSSSTWVGATGIYNTSGTITKIESTYFLVAFTIIPTYLTINDITYTFVEDEYMEYSEPIIVNGTELSYLQNSFELRYPDEDDVGKDYGYLGMEMDAWFIDYALFGGAYRTQNIPISFFGSDTITIEESDFKNGSCNVYVDGTLQQQESLPYTIDVSGAEKIYFQPYGNTNWSYLKINGTKYYLGKNTVNPYDTASYEPYINKKMYSDYGLKRVIDWVGNCSDEEFVADFEKYFNKQYVLRYYLLVIVCGMVDNLGKNMMLDTWDGQIWYPRFYDMDTICSYDNSGEIKFDVDIEMAQGYWNTSSSRLWTKVRDLFHDDLVETYKNLRQNNFSYDKFMQYFYDKQIAQIPQTYYNKDYDVKYAPYATEYMGKAHGDGYEHLRRWLKRRLIFTDTLFDYAPSYENDKITIRANTLDLMNIEIETYTPVYQHVSFYNGNMEKEKVDGKVSTIFSGTAQTATDQEVLIYGGSNIKRIKGLSSMNPNSMLIGNASKLVDLDVSDCPILTTVNSNKANFAPHTYLNKLDISNCPQLEGTLNISGSPLLQDLNAMGTAVDSILFAPSIRNLETLRVPKTISSLTLNDAGLLNTLELEQGTNLQSVSMTNCNSLTNAINFDLTKTPTVSLDNSYNAEELYMSSTTNLTLKNMATLERVIFTPNNEYSQFDINNIINGPSYKVTTFNNPKMKDFITTAPQRESYGYSGGDIQPNTVFSANTLDLSDTQFENVKFLCTTDLYNLKVPTTMKNFYCDSAMDIDTDVVPDGSYNTIHNTLVEPYTTNYEGEVVVLDNVTQTITQDDMTLGQLQTSGSVNSSTWCYVTDYIPILGGSQFSIIVDTDSAPNWTRTLNICGYDSDKNCVDYYHDAGVSYKASTEYKFTVDENVAYIRLSMNGNNHILTTKSQRIPNLIPSSANGSLIFNMYSNNTTAPTSTSPYMWDLTGLKLNDFHTFGMNNWVKASDDSYVKVGKEKIGAIFNRILYWADDGVVPGLGDDSNKCVYLIKVTPGQSITITRQTTGNAYYSKDGITKHGNLTGFGTEGTLTVPNDMNYIIMTAGRADTISINGIEYTFYDISSKNLEDLLPYAIDTSNLEYTNIYSSTPTSITMPQRMSGYSVRMVNADITPVNYATHLYPLLVDTTLPITGKLDYTKYTGTSLAWAYAYTTSDVTIDALQRLNNITNSYNKLYGTDFVDVVSIDVTADMDASNLGTSDSIIKVFIELTADNKSSRIDEVLQWYPNCHEVHFYHDDTLTSLSSIFQNNTTYRNQIHKIVFMDGYFPNATYSLKYTFAGCTKLVEIVNLPKPNSTQGTFQNCESLTTHIDWSSCTDTLNLSSTFQNCKALVKPPILPPKVSDMIGCFNGCSGLTTPPVLTTGFTNMEKTFYGCSKLTSAPVIPSSVTNLTETFYNCSALTVAPVIPESVTTLKSTFRATALVVAPDIPSKVTTLYKCFDNCKSLTTAPKTIPAGVTDMNGTFGYCNELKTAPDNIPEGVTTLKSCFMQTSITSAPTIPSTVTNLNSTFHSCTKLVHGPEILSTSVTEVSYLYYNCSKLEDAYMPVYGSCVNYGSYHPFNSCSKLTKVTWIGEATNNFDVKKLSSAGTEIPKDSIIDLVENHLGTVSGKTLTLGDTYLGYLTDGKIAIALMKGWTVAGAGTIPNITTTTDTTSLTSDSSVTTCLIQVNDTNYKTRLDEVCAVYPNTTSVCLYGDGTCTNLSSMFNCNTANNPGYNPNYKAKIKEIYFIKGGFTQPITLSTAFTGTTTGLNALEYVDFGGITLDNIAYAFQACIYLKTVDMTGVTLTHTSLHSLFINCYALEDIIGFEDLDVSQIRTWQVTFQNCYALRQLDFSHMNLGKASTFDGTFRGIAAWTEIDLGSKCEAFNTTRNVDYWGNTFRGCENLQYINMSKFSMSNVKASSSIVDIFYKCYELTNIEPATGLYLSHNLSYCTKLSADELVQWFNAIGTATSGATITLGETLLAKLTDDQKAIAINKGWALA